MIRILFGALLFVVAAFPAQASQVDRAAALSFERWKAIELVRADPAEKPLVKFAQRTTPCADSCNGMAFSGGNSSGGVHQVVFDAVATSPVSNTGASATLSNSNMTVGSGSNRALIALADFSALSSTCPPPGLTVTWGAQSMTQIGFAQAQDSANPCAMLFGLVNPTSGNQTLTASWTGNRDAVLTAISFTGVNQTGGATSFPNSNSANDGGTTGTSASVTVSSASNAYVVTAFVGDNTFNGTVGPAGATAIPMNVGGSGLSFITAEGSYVPGAASITATATLASGHWGAVGTSIAPN